MRSRWVMGAFVVLAVLSAVWLVRSSSGGSPLHCAAPKFDYGEVAGSQPIEHIFQLRNTGRKPIVGLRAITSCGCASASLSQTSINPDQSALVHVRLNMQAYRGPQRHRVLVLADDHGIRPLVLIMQGTILDK